MSNEKILEVLMEQSRELRELRREVQELKSQKPKNNCYSIDQVAEATGHSKSTIRKHINCGKLRCYYPNAKHCILDIDLERYKKGLTPRRGKGK